MNRDDPEKPTQEPSLKLLVSGGPEVDDETEGLEIQGQIWVLTNRRGTPSSPRPYTCVSYAWGTERTSNPLDPGRTIPAFALEALKSATCVGNPEAVWIDALCIPPMEPERSQCLGKMGSIYAQAAQTVVVLREDCFVALEQIHESSHLDTNNLAILEADDWVSRAWTYQELVNCNDVLFVSAGKPESSVSAEDLLNRVGTAIQELQKRKGWDSFEFRKRHPNVSALEDLVLDWKIGPYLERTAYQVLSAMHGRHTNQPDERYYAMVGAISNSPSFPSPSTSHDPADYFMKVCETLGDFSFIYTSCPRNRTPGRGWRPQGDRPMAAAFPWHSFGDGQPGSIHEDHLELKSIWLVRPGTPGIEALRLLTKRFSLPPGSSPEDTAGQIHQKLRTAGFSGDCPPLPTEHGFFFPVSPIDPEADLSIAVATGVRMTFGAPGLLVQERGVQAFHKGCGSGIFVGLVPERGESIRVT